MSRAETDKLFGPIVWENERFVVRVQDRPNGLHVFAHRKGRYDAEHLLRGYMLGSNALHFTSASATAPKEPTREATHRRKR